MDIRLILAVSEATLCPLSMRHLKGLKGPAKSQPLRDLHGKDGAGTTASVRKAFGHRSATLHTQMRIQRWGQGEEEAETERFVKELLGDYPPGTGLSCKSDSSDGITLTRALACRWQVSIYPHSLFRSSLLTAHLWATDSSSIPGFFKSFSQLQPLAQSAGYEIMTAGFPISLWCGQMTPCV